MASILDITQQEIDHISLLSNRTYIDSRMSSNSSIAEKAEFDRILLKFEDLADYFAQKYNREFGPFSVGGISKNRLNRAGTKIKGFWMCIYKGVPNKQYAAQVSFVIDTTLRCLNVGFYFGFAESQDAPNELDKRLRLLGRLLSKEIMVKNSSLRQTYHDALEYGFKTYSGIEAVSSVTWGK